jgi:hypothetical protein
MISLAWSHRVRSAREKGGALQGWLESFVFPSMPTPLLSTNRPFGSAAVSGTFEFWGDPLCR